MSVTNAGRDHIVAAVTGVSAGTVFNNANAYIGIGSGTTAFAASQTALVSALTSARVAMDSTYPTVTSGNIMTFRSTYSTSQANGSWQEWAVFNASSAGTMLNRKVEDLGTKPGTQTWQFTVTITLTVPSA